MADHAEVELLLPAYAVGALTDDGLEEVELHLEECPICRAETRTLLSLTTGLRLAVLQVDPPTSLADRVHRAAIDEPSVPGAPARLGRGWAVSVSDAATRGPADAAPGMDVGETREAVSPAPTPIPLRPRRGVPRVPVYWAAIAAVLPLVLSGWLGYQTLNMRRTIDTMQLAASQAWSRTENVTDIMGRGIMVGADAASLQRTENAPAASGMFYYLPAEEKGVMVVDGLPALPRGQCYQVWLVSGDKAMDGGKFYLGSDGKGIFDIKSPMPLSSIEMVRVTMEPHGGSEEPKGNRYIWARLKST